MCYILNFVWRLNNGNGNGNGNVIDSDGDYDNVDIVPLSPTGIMTLVANFIGLLWLPFV